MARAIVMEPEFIIADEPISALDVSSRAQVLNLLKKLQAEKGLTYLFIAHDLSVVRFISDRIAVIHKSRIVELAAAEELFLIRFIRIQNHYYQLSLSQNPRLEKNKKLVVYTGEEHDYTVDKPKWTEIKAGHFVWANEQEVEYLSKTN